MVSIPLIGQFTVIICNPIYEPWSSYKDVADFSNNNASSKVGISYDIMGYINNVSQLYIYIYDTYIYIVFEH